MNPSHVAIVVIGLVLIGLMVLLLTTTRIIIPSIGLTHILIISIYLVGVLKGACISMLMLLISPVVDLSVHRMAMVIGMAMNLVLV